MRAFLLRLVFSATYITIYVLLVMYPIRKDGVCFFTNSLNLVAHIYRKEQIGAMIRLLFLSLFLTSFYSPPAHLIDWNASRKLTWADFKGSPVKHSSNAALSSTSIHFSYGYGDKRFTYSISCQFDKNRSWVRVRTNYILSHEQAHFDIAELYARKLKRAISKYRYNENTVSDDLNNIYEDIMKQHHEAQSKYDKETDHSRNPEQQVFWLKKIREELEESREFASYK